MIYRSILMITLIAVSALLASCDKRELSDRAFVIAIAADKNHDPAESVKVILSIANVEAISSRGENDEMESLMYESGKTFAAALNGMENSVYKNVFFGHAKLLILSNDILNDSRLLKNVLDTVRRTTEINHRIIVLAAPSSEDYDFKDLMVYEKNKQPLLGFFVQNYFRNNASVPKMDLETLISAMETNRTALIPAIHIDSSGITISGAAVVKDWAQIYELNEDYAQAITWVLSKPRGTVVTADEASLEVNRINRKIAFAEKSGRLQCTLTLTVHGVIAGNPANADEKNALVKAFEDEIRDIVMKTYGKLYGELKTDGFGLRELLRKRHKGLFNAYGGNFTENLDFSADVTVKIVR